MVYEPGRSNIQLKPFFCNERGLITVINLKSLTAKWQLWQSIAASHLGKGEGSLKLFRALLKIKNVDLSANLALFLLWVLYYVNQAWKKDDCQQFAFHLNLRALKYNSINFDIQLPHTIWHYDVLSLDVINILDQRKVTLKTLGTEQLVHKCVQQTLQWKDIQGQMFLLMLLIKTDINSCYWCLL